jgi:hypothetical protein
MTPLREPSHVDDALKMTLLQSPLLGDDVPIAFGIPLLASGNFI